MRSRLPLIVAVPLAALAIGGCGGGGGDESTESSAAVATTTAPTKAELLEQGDAICAEVNAAAGSDESSVGEGGSPAVTLAGLYSGMVSSLNNIGTPQESAGYAEFSSAAEELAKAEDEVKLAAEREDAAGLEAAESTASTALAEFQEAASEYGFEDCAEGPTAPTPSGSTGTEAGESEAEGGVEAEAVEPEAVEPEPEAAPAPEEAPEAGGAGVEGGGTGGGTGGGGESGGASGGIGPG